MKIRIRLFAAAREAAGRSDLELDLPEGAAVRTALDALYAEVPALQATAASCRTAVGLDFAGPGRILRDGEEISLIPPVQGG